MDVTSDTVEAEKLLSGETATKNDGTKVTGSYAVKLESLTVTPSEEEQVFTENFEKFLFSKEVRNGGVGSDGVPTTFNLDVALTPGKKYKVHFIYNAYDGMDYPIANLTREDSVDFICDSNGVTIDQLGSMYYIVYDTYAECKGSSSGDGSGWKCDFYEIDTADGYKPVTVSAIPSNYVGSSVPLASATTITPTESIQTAVSSGYYTTGPISVNAIPSSYVIPSGTYSITSNGTYDVGSYKSVSVNATGEYYGIYKALANGEYIVTTGATSYTAQEVQDYCDSLSSIYNNQFVQRNFVPSGIIFNNVTTIGEYAFGSIYNNTVSGNYRGSLVYSFPSLLSIKEAAFIYNFFIREIYAPVCTSIGTFAFANCSNLTTASFPSATRIGTYAFASCAKLETASFPSVTTIGLYAFEDCRNLTTANFPLATYVGDYAFINCMSLTTASFPSVTSIGGYAFDTCRNLTTANFPSVTSIGGRAFDDCKSLTSANFPACTTIGNYAFNGCLLLTTISFPSCVSISGYAFNQCQKIITADFPACTTIGSYAFSVCLSLTTISFPVCTSIGAYAFFSCKTLSTVNFPKCITINSNAFCYCDSLTSASFPVCTSIGSYAFRGCNNLLSLYLLGSSVPTLTSFTAFNSTPIDGYTTSTGGVYGSIYVPASLYDSYITATNWSVYSARIVSV